MKVRMTFDLDARCRRAINAHSGQKGLATHKHIVQEIDALVTAHLEDLCSELDAEEFDKPGAKRGGQE